MTVGHYRFWNLLISFTEYE